MRTNGTKRRASPQQVLADLTSLSNAELKRLMPQVFALSTGRGRHLLSTREESLLSQINSGLPAHLQIELNGLTEKRRAGTLTDLESQRLHRLTDKAELLDARRLRCLVELAGIRKISLGQL